ncbi:MAG: hypothetical protein OQK58_10875, partial [Gammaproteobacteria bacterium]|nr:hypothetical protein [Gammaproteobacteria bacterium]
MKHINKLFILILIMSSGCSTESTRKTLRDIDVTAKKQMQQKVFIKEKSKTDIRKAYSDYLK